MSKAPENETKSMLSKRLYRHIMTAETRWFKVSGWLIEVGFPDGSDYEVSKNPIRRLLCNIGCWMSDLQTRAVNKKFNKEHYGECTMCKDGNFDATGHRCWCKVD